MGGYWFNLIAILLVIRGLRSVLGSLSHKSVEIGQVDL